MILRLVAFFFVYLNAFGATVLASTGLQSLIDQGHYGRAGETALNSSHRASQHALTDLLEKAVRLKVDEHPVWRRLLLMKKNWLGGWQSQVDDAGFFLSQDGSRDSRRELAATLAGFFVSGDHGMDHPQCRFPARFYWLERQLKFYDHGIRPVDCRRIDSRYGQMQPDTMVLVFPVPHPEKLSSLFGHTLLRFEQRGRNPSAMLAPSINFAAQLPGEVNHLDYVLGGIFGGFTGTYTANPFHEKLKLYAEIESRDIWEYPLELSKDERRFIFLHALELLGTQFDYYFFSENCSYHLLSLIEVAFPDIELSTRYDLWVLPLDVIQLLSTENIIHHGRYRPSLKSRIVSRLGAMSSKELRLTEALLDHADNVERPAFVSQSVQRQALMLDLAADILHYRRLADNGSRNDNEHKLLFHRSRLSATRVKRQEPVGTDPATGHGSAAAALGLGRENDDAYYQFTLRAGYHDWLDPLIGHNDHSSVDVLSLDVRHWPDYDRTQIQRVSLFDLMVLHPYRPMMNAWSWRARFGWQRRALAPNQEHGITEAGIAGGGALALHKKALGYTLLGGSLKTGSGFHEQYTLAPEVSLGLVWRFTHQWRWRLQCQASQGVLRDEWEQQVCKVEQGYSRRDFFIKFHGQREHIHSLTQDSFGFSAGVYF